MSPDLRAQGAALTWSSWGLIAAAALLGGASRENPLRLAAVELIALVPLCLALGQTTWSRAPSAWTFALAILALAIAIPLVQLIPLPPAVWTRLPDGGARAQALALAGLSLDWRPISIAPGETLNGLLAMIPPAAGFAAAARLDRPAREIAVMIWIGCAASGLILGAAQLASPGGGWAYPYATTNLGSLVGWFANRNHEAGALLTALPCAAALIRSERRGTRPWRAWAMGLFGLVAVAALGVIHSRAGIILAAPVLAFSLFLIWRAEGRVDARRMALAAGALALAVGAVALASLSPILDRFTGGAGPEFRLEAWPIVIKAAWDHLPLGAGIGSFDRVFRAVEPLRLVAAHFFNHAHNDYLEIWLEAGWPGVAALAGFIAWFAVVGWRAWRGGDVLARAAGVAGLALLAQSLVDYPLRTESLAVWFAFCCGLLVAPSPERARS